MSGRIKKVVLDLGGKEVTLTIEQVRNLKSALDELFGKKIIYERYLPVDFPRLLPYPWYFRDTVVSTPATTQWTFTTSGTDSGTLKISA